MTKGSFSDDPTTRWLSLPGDEDRKMEMLADFTYTDWVDKAWTTPFKYRIDGASIPRALWTLVGSPYEGMYRRASIVHDKACEDAVGDATARKRADKMFYQACRTGGCNMSQAAILYVGVRIGANFSRAGLIDINEDLSPRLNELPVELEMRAALQQIAGSPEVAAATTEPVDDEADALEAAVGFAGKRHFAQLAGFRSAALLDWD